MHITGKRFLGRTGTILIEVLLAASLFGGVMIALMMTFTGTQKQATTSEARLHASVLAQIVTERLRAHVVMNPSYFRTRAGQGPTFTLTGSVVAAGAAVGQGLAPSP